MSNTLNPNLKNEFSHAHWGSVSQKTEESQSGNTNAQMHSAGQPRSHQFFGLTSFGASASSKGTTDRRQPTLNNGTAPVPAQITDITPPGGEVLPLGAESAKARLNAVPPQQIYQVEYVNQGFNITACTDACMNMVSKYFGGPTKPLPAVWNRPRGLTTDDIKNEMGNRGFASVSVMRKAPLTSNYLYETLAAARSPLIASTSTHAFVITGIIKDTVYIADPLRPSKKQMTIAELNQVLDFSDRDNLLKFKPFRTAPAVHASPTT